MVDIIFAIFKKKELEILDYNKMQSRPKYSVSLPHRTIGWSAVCYCDISCSHSHFSKHSLFQA